MSGKIGYLFVMLAALLWAISGTVSKFIFASGISPVELVQLRAAGATFFLAMALGVGNRSLLRIARKDAGYFFTVGILLAVTQYTYLFAISKTLVAVAILLQYQAPVVVALYAFLVLRERIARLTIAAIVCSLLGCYLAVGGYSLHILSMSKAGIISGLCSAVTFALYTVRSDCGMDRYSPWTILFYAFAVAAIIWNVVYPPFHAVGRSFTWQTWWWVFFIAVFGTILPFGFYSLGIKGIRPQHASVTATLEPIAAGAMSFIFLGEILETWQIVGAVLVITAIIILQHSSPEVKVNQIGRQG